MSLLKIQERHVYVLSVDGSMNYSETAMSTMEGRWAALFQLALGFSAGWAMYFLAMMYIRETMYVLEV